MPSPPQGKGWTSGVGSRASGSWDQVGLSTNLMFLPLTCPFAETSDKTVGAQACPSLQSPLTLLPPTWQTLPSWNDPRAHSTPLPSG